MWECPHKGLVGGFAMGLCDDKARPISSHDGPNVKKAEPILSHDGPNIQKAQLIQRNCELNNLSNITSLQKDCNPNPCIPKGGMSQELVVVKP